MNKPCACLGHSNPAEGFCACDCGELAQTPQRNSAGQGAKIAAPVIPDFKPSLLERALFPVIGIWNVLVGALSVLGFTFTALKGMAVFVFGVWAMPTTARKVSTEEHDASDHWVAIFGFGSLAYPIIVTGIVVVTLIICAGVLSGDWHDYNKRVQIFVDLFSTYVQPFLIPLAITNALSFLYEIGRTKRKFAKTPQAPNVV